MRTSNTELDNLRARFGSLKSVGRKAKTGDFVTIDLKAVIDGEEVDSISGVSYEIGKGNMLKGLDTALRGLKTDESATFTTELAGGEHAGEQAEVTVTATAVKQRELPKVRRRVRPARLRVRYRRGAARGPRQAGHRAQDRRAGGRRP